MDSLHATAAFAIAAGLLTITPGLDTALVLRAAAIDGPRRGMEAAFGIAFGVTVWALAATVGLGALLAASRLAYGALRAVGALYMLWLGAHMLAAAFVSPAPVADLPATMPGQNWLLRGFLTNLLNPKVGVFYVTFLPLFIPSGASVVGFGLLLAFIHTVQGLLWFWLLTSLMRPLARWLQRPIVRRALDGLTGSVLLGFGAGLLLDRR